MEWVGAPAGGEVASRLAVTSILEAIDRIWNPDGQIIGTAAATAATFAERLRDSFVEAHARIQAYAAERPWLHGMGTTATALASRAARWSSLTSATRAHTYCETSSSYRLLEIRPGYRTWSTRGR